LRGRRVIWSIEDLRRWMQWARMPAAAFGGVRGEECGEWWPEDSGCSVISTVAHEIVGKLN
jgi:hypothetical protein